MATMEAESQTVGAFVVAPGVGAIAFAVAIVLLSANGLDLDLQHMLRTPRVAAWTMLIGAQATLWVLVFPIAFGGLSRRRALVVDNRGVFIAMTSGLLLLFLPFILGHAPLPPGIEYPATQQRIKMIILTCCGFAVLLALLVAMHAVALEAHGTARSHPDIAAYMGLKNELGRYLMLTGVIIAAATLSTGTLQETLAELNPAAKIAEDHRHMLTLIYGGFGCGLVALVYVPALTSLRSAGRLIRDSVAPPPAGDLVGLERVNAWETWSANRSSIEKLIGLQRDPGDLLKDGLALLAPFAGSAISLLTGLG